MEGRKDDLNEFRLLYKSKAPKLIFFASKYVSTATAEDIVHDQFVKVWLDFKKLDLTKNIDSYLLFGVKNACLDYLRHLKIKQTYISRSLYKENFNELLNYTERDLDIESEQLKLLYAEIEQLPNRCREIFILSYIEGLSNDEIASTLSLSKRTVESHLYKGLCRLKSRLNYNSLILLAAIYLNSRN